MANLSQLKSVAEWPKMRPQVEKAVLGTIGRPPKNRTDLQLKTVDEFEEFGYIRRRVNYFVDEWQRISAWIFIPTGREDMPGIVCCHSESPQGKDEPAGLKGDKNLAFARHYAEMGFVTIAPDSMTAGERVSPGLEPFNPRQFYKDHPKMSVMGKMLFDHIHAVDALCDHREVDSARIGVIGHGLGGHNALMLAAFDERIQACVSSCPFVRFADDKKPERWIGEPGMNLMPRLKSAISNGEFPWDWEHVLALAAPNPTLIMCSPKDEYLEDSKSIEHAVKLARKVYELLGRGEALEVIVHKDGRAVSQRLVDSSDEWFERWL